MRDLNTTNNETKKDGTINKKALAVMGAILVIWAVAITMLSNMANNRTETQPVQQEQNELSLADTTPLKDSIFWDTYRDYPKYRLEAAERVEELVAEGMTEEEACSIAIDEVTTKVFEEKCEFIQKNNELGDGIEEAYQLYLKETQY